MFATCFFHLIMYRIEEGVIIQGSYYLILNRKVIDKTTIRCAHEILSDKKQFSQSCIFKNTNIL